VRLRLVAVLTVAVVLGTLTWWTTDRGHASTAASAESAALAPEALAPGDPPTPDLSRPVLLSLARRSTAFVGTFAALSDLTDPYVTGPGAGSPIVFPPPPLTSGTGALYAVGDSVLLGTEPYLRSTLSGWDVRLDGRVGRGVPEGFNLVRMNGDRLGDVLVVLLGHNYGGGGGFGPSLERLLRDLDDVPRVVLVTVVEWSRAQPEVNRAIRAAPLAHDNVVVADWAAVVEKNPGFLRDHVHTTAAGATALANLITVMVGQAPARNGTLPPPPRLLAIPPVGPGPSVSSSGGSRSSTTTTVPWSGTSTTSTTTTTSTTSTTASTTTTTTTTVTTVDSTSTTTATTVPQTTTTSGVEEE